MPRPVRATYPRTRPRSSPGDLELGDGTHLSILYEDRAVLAIDKPAGWLLVPVHWRETRRNLQAALESGIAAGAFWARSRNLKFLRFVHRLDAETSGVLLLARSPGALGPLSALFEERQVEKRYLAVVRGEPREAVWTCQWPLADDPEVLGRVRVDRQAGRPAETAFVRLASRADPQWGRVTLLEARPLTGRTHQVRAHLAASGHAVVGDPAYGVAEEDRYRHRSARDVRLGLRAAELVYPDPFTHRRVRIQAPCAGFLQAFGFAPTADRRPA